MKHLRFSIAGMMSSVGLAAVVFAALRDPSALWASIIFSITIACLAAAAVLAVCSRARAAWSGMAVFGFVYIHFALAEYPSLVTGYVLDAAAERIIAPRGREIATYTREGQLQGWYELGKAIESTTRSVPEGSVDLLAYRQIGHSALGLLVGVCGAGFGLIVGRRERQAEG